MGKAPSLPKLSEFDGTVQDITAASAASLIYCIKSQTAALFSILLPWNEDLQYYNRAISNIKRSKVDVVLERWCYLLRNVVQLV